MALIELFIGKIEELTTFVRKHRTTVLTYAGAAIVFATFVVKDGIRDNVRDLVGDIKSAQDIHILRRDSGVVIDLLRTVERNVELSQALSNHEQLKRSTVEQTGINLFNGVVTTDGNLLSTVEASLGNISRLIDRLPEDQHMIKRRTEIDRDLKNVVVRSILIATNWNENMPMLTDDKRWSDKTLELLHQVTNLETDTGRLLIEMNQFESDVVLQAQDILEKKERAYERYTWMSYILYTAGWVLSLFGRLTGVEVSAE
jgi:uncharacterized membrane-anchored protein YjiN (DUF445 family)